MRMLGLQRLNRAGDATERIANPFGGPLNGSTPLNAAS
jgi:hypothetical protein